MPICVSSLPAGRNTRTADVDGVVAVPVGGRRGNAQVAVVLAHRELVQQLAGHFARGDVRSRAVRAERELVDQCRWRRRSAIDNVGRLVPIPRHGRQVDARRRGVHGLAVRHDTGRPDGLAVPCMSIDAIHDTPRPANSLGAATAEQSSVVEMSPNDPSLDSSNARGIQSSTVDCVMMSLLRCSARSSSRPNWSGWTNGRRVAIDDVSTKRAVPSIDSRRNEVTLEMAAVQQRRRRHITDVEQRHHRVDARCTAGSSPAVACRRATVGGSRRAGRAWRSPAQRRRRRSAHHLARRRTRACRRSRRCHPRRRPPLACWCRRSSAQPCRPVPKRRRVRCGVPAAESAVAAALSMSGPPR